MPTLLSILDVLSVVAKIILLCTLTGVLTALGVVGIRDLLRHLISKS